MATGAQTLPTITIEDVDEDEEVSNITDVNNDVAIIHETSVGVQQPTVINNTVNAEQIHNTIPDPGVGQAGNGPTAPDTEPAVKIWIDTPSPSVHNGAAPKLGRHSSRESLREDGCKHLSEEDLILAETLIKDAETGRNFTYKTDPVYVRFYILYHKWYWRWTLYLFILLNMALVFMETPAREGWGQPYWATMILEVVCLVFFIARLLHVAYFSLPSIFWRDTKNIMVIGIIALTIVDILVYVIWVNAAPDTHPVRWSRPLRSLLIINFSDGRQIRRAFRNIRRTVPDIMNVIVLFFVSVLLFALLALKLFGRRSSLVYPDGHAYFKNYFESIWDLYVLVTTANFPDVILLNIGESATFTCSKLNVHDHVVTTTTTSPTPKIPAYDENNWFALFFISYLIICLYMCSSIVLAAIYNSYRNNLKNEIKDSVYGKRRKLKQAFAILKVKKNGVDIITASVWTTIMTRVLPNKSKEQIDLMFSILDLDNTHEIARSQFLNLITLLQVPLTEVKDRQTLLEQKMPHIYNSRASEITKRCVRHKFFRFFFDFTIFLNAWFIGFDVNAADWFFLIIFIVEIALKLYVFGPKEFFMRFWNAFDFFVIGAAVVATTYERFSGKGGEEFITLDILLILRVMRLIKILGSIERFKVILMTIVNIGPSILTYGGVIFVQYYMFAVVGLEIFHGLVRYNTYNETSSNNQFCGNPSLNGSTFYLNHYCSNNFNDILKAFVLLFELTVVNQWHVLSSGFVLVTNKFARIYFFAFHMSCVIIGLNIFVAFILEAFILEYSILKTGTGRLESVIEAKIKELGLGIGQTSKMTELGPPEVDKIDINLDRGLKFHLKKKSSKSVEVLLQQMFEGEITAEDDGDDDMDCHNRTVTLDSIHNPVT